ncbi:ABC transporter substrate-binding protein/permease [Streptococcus australis]|uniref:ABC transporter substrate-binding protein/permease n=1 Tax=Streptococcus australis TaxID=113107 RepID=UPI0039C44E7B
MKKKLVACLLFLFPLFAFASQAQAETVKVVFDTAYAPFEFKDSDQVYKGIDVEILDKVAEINGWTLEKSFPGFDAAVNAVQAGQADAIMAGMTKTKEREQVFAMSDTYYDTKVVIATKKANKITSYDQLKGKTVGVKNGTAAQRFLQKNKDKYGYTIKTFDTSDLMNNSLSTGAVDAIMDDQPVIEYAIKQGQDLSINMEGEAVGSFAFGVKKDGSHENLIKQFNTALAQMKKDGTLDQIIEKWTGSSQSSSSTTTTTASTSAVPETSTEAGQKATPKKKTYKISSDSSFAPFVFQNDQSKYTGIDMELIKAIAKDQGFTLEISNPGFDAAVSDVQNGNADGMIAGMTVTDARKATFDFSDPYYTTNSILAVQESSKISSYEDLKGKTVGVKNGTASQTFLEENKSKYGYKIKTFSDGASMYDSLNSGSVAAIMDDEPVIKYAIKQGRKFKTPIEGTPSGQIAFAVQKDSNPELIEMFNNGLANLKESGEYQKILDKYLSSDSEETTESTSVDETTIWGLLQNNYKQLLGGLGVTIALALISFAIAMVVGIIFGMFSVSPYKWLRWTAEIFVDVIRGIPLMILAAFIFWGIPNLIESMTGHQSPINDFLAGTIALSLNAAAYIAEIVRGGIQAVPAGQMEASRSLGISYSKTMRKIILPQATKLMLPNFVNQFVIALKDTTIVSAIGLVELFQTGKIIIARNYQSFKMYAILAVFYLVIITLLTRFAKQLEKRAN